MNKYLVELAPISKLAMCVVSVRKSYIVQYMRSQREISNICSRRLPVILSWWGNYRVESASGPVGFSLTARC